MTLVDDITFTGEIHPAAEAWPLLPDDELEELAASIADIGLQEPLTLDPAGRLLDGRNRLNACTLAGVEPEFVVYDGDPVPFIIAKNGDRRHMSTGAKAMTTAIVLADAGYRRNGRWAKGAVSNSEDSHSSAGWLRAMRDAGAVIDHTPTLAAKVIAGDMALDAAYRKAQEAKAEAESDTSRMDRLKAKDRKLASQVAAGDLTLSEAEGALRERERELAKLHKIHVERTRKAVDAWSWLTGIVAGQVPEMDAIRADLNDRDLELLDEAIAVIEKGMSA